MTDSERQQILKMIDEGKITAEEGLKLMQALGEDEPEDVYEAIETASPPKVENDPDPVVEKIKRQVRSLYLIPLAAGTFLTVAMAWLMYQSMEAQQMGFAFYCLLFPTLLFGMFLLIIGAASQSSRWIYVDVKQKHGKKPGRILIGFPLDLARWLIGSLGNAVPGKQGKAAASMMEAINDTTREEPMVVQVDEGPNGNKVRVYIG